jgi:hypothetical protein
MFLYFKAVYGLSLSLVYPRKDEGESLPCPCRLLPVLWIISEYSLPRGGMGEPMEVEEEREEEES